MHELFTVSTTSAELFDGSRVVRHGGLEPDTAYTIEGVELRTLADVGEVRSVVATVNDVHFGEVECGKITGTDLPVLTAAPGEEPYPETMNRSVVADIAAIEPDAVVVKGDLTSFGTLEEFAAFRECYEPAFGDRLTYVRGNHDSYPGVRFADFAVQVVDVEGLRIVLLDTSRDYEAKGFIDDSQIEATRELAMATDETVLVMGHHPLYSDGHDDLVHFDGVNAADSARLLAGVRDLPHVVAYCAGHTHRSRRVVVDGFTLVEVACVKDFPGAWAEYVVGRTGIAQVTHRATAPAAIAWAERTRQMFSGHYGAYAMGRLSDRCFVLPRSR